MKLPTNEVASDSKSPTTFVQVDTNAFKEVVQRLTGPSSSESTAHEAVGTTAKGNISIRKPAFKLHERRQYKAAKLEIIKPSMSFKQGASVVRSPDQLLLSLSPSPTPSPSGCGNAVPLSSPLSTPTKCFSKLCLGEGGSYGGEPTTITSLSTKEEERAIREKKFYLHPSPRSKPRFHEPELLNLFPLTSPKTGQET